ncbi:hypothetical protein SAMN02744102_03224 [Paenibacillus barengoltzii]|uniref:hypothetical protein n=1 Tax=Paenibacillus barengoltzii TaxID=343517 RepID=UPI000A086584|nr:hypothetical protein [Paenibacillus barengoltzii]SMF43261.1 hypothetical protein SAMN02744102_03224 [Paenibacillus barengoltzii]
MNDKDEYGDLHQNESAYLRQTLRSGLACLMEYVLLLPAWILFAVFLRPPEFPIAGLGLLPLLSLIGVLIGTRLRKLWQRGAVALAAGAVYTVAALAWAGGASALGLGNAASAAQLASTVVVLLQTAALFVAGVFCSLQGLTVLNRQGHFRLYWVGLSLYFLAGIFFPRIEALQATVPLITWAGVFSLATALFVTNHQFLRYSSQAGDSGERLPAGLRRHNRLFVGLIVVAAVLLAAGVGRWIGSLLWRMLQAIVRWLTRPQEPVLPPTEEPEAVTPPLEPMLPAEPQEPGLLSEILNYAFYVFGGLLLAALLGFVLYWLYKNAGEYWRKAIHRLLNLLRRESAAPEQAAYRDEETSLLTWESALQGWRQLGARLLRTGKPSERWEDMRDNRERVRYLYRLFLRKERQRGFSLKPYLTPRETVEELKQESARQAEAAKSARAGKRKRLVGTGGGTTEAAEAAVRQELESTADPLLQLYYGTRYGEETPGDEEVVELRRRLLR